MEEAGRKRGSDELRAEAATRCRERAEGAKDSVAERFLLWQEEKTRGTVRTSRGRQRSGLAYVAEEGREGSWASRARKGEATVGCGRASCGVARACRKKTKWFFRTLQKKGRR